MYSPWNNWQGHAQRMLPVVVDCLSGFYGLSIHAEFMPYVRVPIPPVEVTAGYLYYYAVFKTYCMSSAKAVQSSL
jgi:hypothetical protein